MYELENCRTVLVQRLHTLAQMLSLTAGLQLPKLVHPIGGGGENFVAYNHDVKP